MDSLGPFSVVETLIRAGRLKDAAGALKQSARSGGAAWESYLWMGRIAESSGRLADAELSFRKALGAQPSSPLPRVELFRLLEKMGRSEEASEILRAAAAQAAGELTLLSEHLLRGELDVASGKAFYSLMEFNLYRKAFLEHVVWKGQGLDVIEQSMRSVLASVPQPGARILLAEILIERGRLEEAEAEILTVFMPSATGVEASRLETLLRLIEKGRYGSALEGALLDCVLRARASDHLASQWPQIFSALMCSHFYSEAFRLGEAVLDRFGSFERPGQLMWPWWRKIRRALGEDCFMDQELSRMQAAAKRGGFPQWFAYYQVILLSNRARNREAAVEAQGIQGLDAKRYAWMFQAFVLVRLALLDFDGAIEICRVVLRRCPSHWWIRCRLGEACLAKGDRLGGLKEFQRALRVRDPGEKREVLTWHGEVLLWLGDYKAALKLLDKAIRLGASAFVYGWRGAARLKLGNFPGALADLDCAIELDPKDFEARGWRGETYRLAGRFNESLRDLEIVIDRGCDDLWARFNRALLRDAMGNVAGLAEDFAAIPGEMTSWIDKRIAPASGPAMTPSEMRRILTAGLEWARGVRRWENYVQLIWMNQHP